MTKRPAHPWAYAGGYARGPASPIRYPLALIDDRPLLPAQFYAAPAATPEARLWLAVIEQAFREADHWAPEYRNAARSWLRSDAFAAVCELVGIEADAVRGRRIAWRRRSRFVV